MKLKEKRIKIGNKIIKICVRAQILIIVIAIIICVLIGFIINRNAENNSFVSSFESPKENKSNSTANITVATEINSPTVSPTPNLKIYVHVSGAVKNPGLVSLNDNSRVNDAINAAGGITNNADLGCINLAEYVYDGTKIHIPLIGESPAVIHSTKQPSTPTPQKTPSQDDTDFKKININIASLDELISLNGIGSTIAQNIIDYRERNGNFKSIDEILNVSGIGDSKFEKIKDFICI